MLNMLTELSVFSAKAFILVLMVLFMVGGIIALVSRGKESGKGRFILKNLNDDYRETETDLLSEMLSKDKFKTYLKNQKNADKEKKKLAETTPCHNLFVLDFNGDIKASAVDHLREEITALLNIANSNDEVVVRVESGGGMVHAYGLAAAQLARLRQQNIPLTVIVDKVAASGGYLMASVANQIIAAPFAIIGSIGVIVQLPNFHRLLKEKHIDFEQLTAGSFKRTLTMFGHNTPEAREKLQTEIEEIHHLFKDAIVQYRPQLDVSKVATGEHWLGSQALALQLVDSVKTSDDYLLEKSKLATVYSLTYKTKKSFLGKLSASTASLKRQLFGSHYLV